MKILQIMPATGWYAKFEGNEGEPRMIDRLVGWALIEGDDSDEVYVVGLDNSHPEGVLNVEITSNFSGYIHHSDLTAAEQDRILKPSDAVHAQERLL